ncbi:MAG: hypothetical protein ACK4SY_07010 [Pyrobaculum sp.]
MGIVFGGGVERDEGGVGPIKIIIFLAVLMAMGFVTTIIFTMLYDLSDRLVAIQWPNATQLAPMLDQMRANVSAVYVILGGLAIIVLVLFIFTQVR